jgi:hypothetical protein
MKNYWKLIIVALVITIGFYFFHTRNNSGEGVKIKGKLMDVSVVDTGNNPFMWILTNGTKTYTKETRTANSHSIERKGIGEKLWLYKYDLKQKKIAGKQKIKLDYLPFTMRLVQHEGKMWLVSTHPNNICFNVFDKITGDTLETLEQFQQRFPVMSAGISSLRYQENPEYGGLSYISVETRDGHSLFYSITGDTLYKQISDLQKDEYLRSQGTQIAFKLDNEPHSGSSARKVLYREEKKEDTYEMYSFELDRMIQKKSGFLRTEKILLDSNHAFLNGSIVYQDQDNAIILHDAGLGDETEDRQRFFTCADRNGKILWQKNITEKISKKLIRSDEGVSSIFFVKSQFHINRINDVFTVSYLGGDGVIYLVNRLNGKEILKLDL